MRRDVGFLLIASVSAVAGVPASANPLAAQRPDTTVADSTVFRISGIRIQAERPVTTVGGSSAIEASIDSLGLPASPTVEEVLREIPSVHVRTNSRGEAEISVRGSESRQVTVLVDGVPLTLGWDGRADVSVLPASAVRDLSVVRGLSSVLHGPNVLGGVIEMSVGRVLEYTGPVETEVSGGLDDNGGYAASASTSIPFESTSGRWLVRAGAGYRDSPGAPLADGIREAQFSEGSLRLNTDFRNADGFATLRYRGVGGEWFSASGFGYRAERGIAAELGAQDPRLWRYPEIQRTIVALSGGTGDRVTPLGRGDVEASIGLDLGRTEIESFATRDYDQVTGREQGDARTLTLRLLGDHTLGERADLRGAFTLADIRHDATVNGSLAEYQQRLVSVGAETIVRLVDRGSGAIEALRLSVGGAFDRGTTPLTGGLPSLGTLDDWGARIGVTAVLNGGGTLAHGGISRRGRFPSLRETYSEALNRFVPNPDLEPEHLVALEAGVTTRAGNGEVQIVGFHHRLSGAIRRITMDDGRRQRINADRIESTGVELLMSQTWGPVTFGADATLQAVDLIDPGTSASSEPENLPSVEGGVHVILPVGAGFTVRGETEFTGSQFCQDPDTGVDIELDGGTWLNASVSRSWSVRAGAGRFSRLRTSATVTNIADEALFDQCGLPRPGRLFGFRVQLF